MAKRVARQARTRVMTLRAPEDVIAGIRRTAKAYGMSVSRFVETAALARAGDRDAQLAMQDARDARDRAWRARFAADVARRVRFAVMRRGDEDSLQ